MKINVTINLPNSLIAKIARKVERSVKIKSSRVSRKRWSRSDLEFLRAHAGRWNSNRIARKLGRSNEAIRYQAFALGISLRKRRRHIRLAA